MDLTDAIRGRRSTAPVTDAAPTDAQLYEYLALAAHAPDHAGLRPWRLVALRGEDRARLGTALAEGFGDPPGSAAAAKAAARPLRAPLLLTVIGCPVADHPKVPAWEQIAAVGALVATLELVLFDAGWTAMWRTGPGVALPGVRQLLGVGEHEQLLGWLYIGGRTDEPSDDGPDSAPDRTPDPDVSGRISTLP